MTLPLPPLPPLFIRYAAGYDYRGYPAAADYARPDPYYGYPAGYDRNTAAAAAAYPYANSYARSYDMAAYSKTLYLLFSFLFPLSWGVLFLQGSDFTETKFASRQSFPFKLVILFTQRTLTCPGMYGAAQAGMGVGTYGQAPSNYGPARGYTTAPMGGGVADYAKERGGAAARQTGYHPYRRN